MPVKSNITSFIKRVKDRNKEYSKRALETYKGSSMKLIETLQADSPVNTGRYKSGHTLSIHHPSAFVPSEDENFDALAEQQLTNAKAALDEVRSEKIIKVFIVNNLPYAESVENGTANSPPRLIYGKAKTKFSDIVEESANNLKDK